MNVPQVKLTTDVRIPQIGFGTWQNRNEKECIDSVKAALEVGYRHIDTAQIYQNEKYIGQAIAESGLKRQELFITTKIWNDNMFWDDIGISLDESLRDLRTDYADLVLLHFPVTELRRPAWRRLEEILATGKIKAIGVSNYTVRHLEQLLSECNVKPAVNQVELHVYLQQPELVKYCKDNQIAIEAYSPLAHGVGLDNPVLAAIAVKYQKTVPQIMLRWCIENDLIVLPKTVNPKRIKENFEIFDFKLDDEDLALIKTLERDLRTCWDPTNVA